MPFQNEIAACGLQGLDRNAATSAKKNPIFRRLIFCRLGLFFRHQSSDQNFL